MKTIFVITPIGKSTSPERRKAEGLLRILRSIFNDADIKVEAAHEINSSGNINQQIIERLVDSDLVICNLTGLNSNVLYELGIRHTVGKQTILISEEGEDLPFDIRNERVIFYSDDLFSLPDLSKAIKERYDQISFDKPDTDSPVFKYKQYQQTFKNIPVESSDQLILDKISQIEEKISKRDYLVPSSIYDVIVSAEEPITDFNLEKMDAFFLVLQTTMVTDKTYKFLIRTGLSKTDIAHKLGPIFGSGTRIDIKLASKF